MEEPLLTSGGERENEEVHATTKVSRKMDSYEMAMARLARDYSGCFKMAGVLGIDGLIDIERMKKALRLLERRHPAARSVLIDWETIEEVESEEGIIPVIEILREKEDTWKEVWNKEQVDPQRLNESAFKLFIIQNNDADGNQSELILSAHHAYADGVSIMSFAHELLLSYENPNIKWEKKEWCRTQQQTAKEIFPWCCPRVYGLYKAIYNVICVTSCRNPSLITQGEGSDRSEGTWHRPSLFSHAFLNADDLLDLRTIAKRKYGLTLNSILVVATMRALSEIINPEKAHNITATSSIDLRKVFNEVLKGKRMWESSDLGLIAGNCVVQSKIGGDTLRDPNSLWEEAIKIQDQYTNADYSTMLSNVLISKMVFKLLPMDDVGETVCISNVGKSCLKNYYESLGRIKFLYPMINYNCLTTPYVCFTTFNDVLSVLACGTVRTFSQETIDDMSKGIVSVLESMLKYQREQNKLELASACSNVDPVATA